MDDRQQQNLEETALIPIDESTGDSNPATFDTENRRSCWVCFASEEDDQGAEWVQPCRCRGTTKWVHQSCLQRWIDEKQRGNSSTKVTCPQCNTDYYIVFPPFGLFVYVMDLTDRMLYRICPFMAAGVVVGSIYWTAVTYGAVTVMQVLGHKEGLTVMEQADPLLLLIGLPTIPLMLVLGKMVRWEEHVLHAWRRYGRRIPGLSFLLSASSSSRSKSSSASRLPSSASSSSGDGDQRDPQVARAVLSDPVSVTRILCGALMLPTIATIFGKTMYDSVPSNLQKALLGGITFVLIKGAFKIYLRQKQYVRQCQRKILNYDEVLRREQMAAAASTRQQHNGDDEDDDDDEHEDSD